MMNKRYLSSGRFLGGMAVVAAMMLVLAGCVTMNEHSFFNSVFAGVGLIISIMVICYWFPKDIGTGYYECPECKSRYIANEKEIINAPRKLFSKNDAIKMKCPYCDKVGNHNKVFSK